MKIATRTWRFLGAGALACALGASCAALSAQAPEHRSFEVASIKRHTADDPGGGWGWQPGGRWTMVNMSVVGLIEHAYPSQIDPMGAPDWAGSEHYDIDARAGFDPNPDQQRELLRGLLAERFKFAGHFKGEERAVYALEVARSDGRIGPGLHPIEIDCTTYRRDATVALTAAGLPPCAYQMSAGTSVSMRTGGRTVQQLGDTLSLTVGRPVVDSTNLRGYYAFTLDFEDAASVFTALQEQLGLRLVSTRGSVDGFVVDHIEHPTED